MTKNLTKEECLDYQSQVTLFGQLVMTWDADLINRYLEQTRIQVDGTMDVILPHFMSLQDINKAKHSMRFLREMGQHILAARKTIAEFSHQEAA